MALPTPPQPPQIVGTLDMRALADVLVKAGDLHEGVYFVAFNLGFAPMNFPSEPNNPRSTHVPGALIAVQSVSLVRQDLQHPAPPGMGVDAAATNPKPKADG